jgi:peptidyl-prolyl cis-trans isomerase D
MLNTMRENAGSWIIKVLLGVIVVAFVFMGAGSFRASRASKIATVNGEGISANQFQRAYNNVLENLRSQFGNRLNDEMIKMLNVKQQALDSVIDTTLLRQAAQKNDLRIPDEELAASITSIPAFQNNGAFDKDRYKILLGQNRLTPETFETIQKEAMIMDQMRSLIIRSAKISDGEARAWYQWENTALDINYVNFKPETYTDIEITDKMMGDYYAAHKEDYRTKPRIQARYIKFDPANYKKEIKVTPEEIAQYYAEYPNEFKTPETVTARHILFSLPEKATNEEAEAARLKAADVLKKLTAGEDFAKLAKTYSDCPSKEKGGDLGSFTRDQMVKPFSDAAFALTVGSISEPVRTQFGWHIIKVDAHNPAATESLEKATPKITGKITDRKAKNLAYDAAESLYNSTFDGEEFAKNAKAGGLDLVTTDFFDMSTGPKGIANAPAFAELAFKLPLMEISDITEIDNAYYLVQVIKTEPEKIPAQDAVKDQVRADVLKEQQKKAAETAAEKFLEKARTAGSLAAAAGENAGIAIKSTGSINRNGSVPGIGNDKAFMTAAFDLTEKNKLPKKIVQSETGIYVIELKERKTPPEQGFKIAEKNIMDRVLQQKQMKLYDSWVAKLRDRSEIKISGNF